jgi:hypothetical protein
MVQRRKIVPPEPQDEEWKCIGLPESIKKKLDALKLIPREPYYSVISRLIEHHSK